MLIRTRRNVIVRDAFLESQVHALHTVLSLHDAYQFGFFDYISVFVSIALPYLYLSRLHGWQYIDKNAKDISPNK